MWDFPLFPEQASAVAGRVDALYFFLVALTAFFSIAISCTIAYFAIKYRRGNKADRSRPLAESPKLEAVWIGVPFIIVMVIFFWGVNVYFTLVRPPSNTQDVYCVGKQWMWKFQHPGGQRELNELHVAVGQPIKVIMTSQDVIHSLYFPEFRIKQDLLPGRYTQLWFQPIKVGTFNIFCAEYCGTNHSMMIGKIVVMEPADYERWLRGGLANGGSSGQSMASAGEQIFQQQGCASCHMAEDATRAPNLKGLYGKSVALRDNRSVIADEQYIRESVLRPTAKIVEGYEPIMPVYQGRISEEDLLQLVAYVKSLAGTDQPAGGAATAPAATVPAATAPAATAPAATAPAATVPAAGLPGGTAAGSSAAPARTPATQGGNETSGNK